MSKPLPLEDFRARRIVLEPDDFAVGFDIPEKPPRDLISEKTWDHLVALPDDVAIRTSNNHGNMLKDASELEHELVCISLAVQAIYPDVLKSPFSYVLIDASGELQASLYNALTGYYRVAFSALRNVIENMTIGLHLELSGDLARFQDWLSGEELKFGWAADNAPKHATVSTLETHLIAAVKDDLFRQKTATDAGGYARRLFRTLCKYTHGAPGYSDSDLWKSNGPIYVGPVLREWVLTYVQTYCYCLILCKLAMPKLAKIPDASSDLKTMYRAALGMLRTEKDLYTFFTGLPKGFW